MKGKNSVRKSLRVPVALARAIERENVESGRNNEHALMIELLAAGLEARRLGAAKQTAKHLASELEKMFKWKGEV